MNVQITPLSDGRLALKPTSFLGRVAFDAYIRAAREAGTTYLAKLKAQVGPLDALPKIVEALTAAGFTPTVDPDIASAVTQRVTTLRSEIAAMRSTGEALARALEERDLHLWPFQIDGVSWLTHRRAGILGDDMGLGKTVQGLVAIPRQAPSVVIGPSVAKGVWSCEARKWRPDLTPVVLKGRNSFRWPMLGEMVVTNFDILPEDLPENLLPGTVVIVDEAHNLKSPKALRSKRARAIVRAAMAKQGTAWFLTGTPLLNRPPELWTLLTHLKLAEETFGSWPAFNRLFWYQGVEGNPDPLVAERLRRVMLRRSRLEVLPDLPTKTHTDHEVEIDAATRRICDEVVRALAEAGINLAEAVEITLNAVTFKAISRARAALATAKIPAMLQMVEAYEENEHPLVVFSAHRAPIDLLGRRPGWATITGDTSPEERTRITAEFQAGRLKGLALTIKAGGVALTLTRAHHALFVDLEWTPALNSQAEDRICRIGQDRGVLILRLIADHELDAKVAAILLRKQALITASVDAAAVGEGAHTRAAENAATMLESMLGNVVTATAPILSPEAALVPHAPASAEELHAADTLRDLHARDRFASLDALYARALVRKLGGQGLTPAEWTGAVKLAQQYAGTVEAEAVEVPF